MKKKGFTLIELLAVITILGIILLIVVPNVTGMLNRSKERINEEQKRTLMDSVKKWGTSNLTLKNDRVYYNNSPKSYVTIGELKNYGYLEDKKIKNLTNKSDISDETKICINYKNNQFVYSINDDNKCKNNYPMMMERDVSKAFWTYESRISTIDVLDNKSVPNNAVASWDVSEKQNKSVMAWIIDDPNNSYMYKLYIGGDGGVAAPADSYSLFGGYESSFDRTKTMNLAKLDTSKVANMSAMFAYCNSLTSLDLSNFDTSNVLNMRAMFAGCNNLTDLNISGFDTNNVKNMAYMFYNCNSLKTLNLSSFDTSKVIYMDNMFYNCNSLTSLDLNNFNTSSVTIMDSMFAECSSLTSLKLCSFDTSKTTIMSYIFSGTSKLTNVYVGSKWKTVATATNMFTGSGVSAVTEGQC